MPSARTNPPEKNATVTIIRGCIANGERQAEGSTVAVSAQTAAILIAAGQAVPATEKPKKTKLKPKTDKE
tara:strand:- start:18 stop:227 length:210 start_codon:yes stop_codon:yes gene_type:complete